MCGAHCMHILIWKLVKYLPFWCCWGSLQLSFYYSTYTMHIEIRWSTGLQHLMHYGRLGNWGRTCLLFKLCNKKYTAHIHIVNSELMQYLQIEGKYTTTVSIKKLAIKICITHKYSLFQFTYVARSKCLFLFHAHSFVTSDLMVWIQYLLELGYPWRSNISSQLDWPTIHTGVL